MIRITRINNSEVQPVPLLGGADTRPVLGAELFPEIYANIFLCAKKKSGKTSAIFHILKKRMGRDTKLVIFCSTYAKDPSWITIRRYFKNKGNDVQAYSSMNEEGINVLDEIIQDITLTAEEGEDEEELDPAEQVRQEGGQRAYEIYKHNVQHKGGRKPKKTKYRAPEYIFVLDDLSTELKSKTLVSLLKKNRHMLCSVILSSQYYLDLLPESRKQIDYYLVFKGQTEDKLEAIYKDADISISYELFKKLYDNATAKPYSFLYIDTREDQFRQNFNKLYSLKDIEKHLKT